jgi:hypothetical protein
MKSLGERVEITQFFNAQIAPSHLRMNTLEQVWNPFFGSNQ